MRFLFAVLLVLLVVNSGQAQTNTIVNYKSSTTAATQVSPTNPLPMYSVPSSGSAIAYSSTAALASNAVIKSAAANLYSFQVAADSTLSATTWWIMIFDATSLPSNGAITPTKCYGIPAGITGASFAFPNPVRFTTGITIGVSTTGCFTQTASTHAFISGDAQ
ncbi:MAG: hypothetical protein KGL39_23920 [Patescibacteria group bacterium]|nr:hypothetical protein [Patescibacteria group bacterium]